MTARRGVDNNVDASRAVHLRGEEHPPGVTDRRGVDYASRSLHLPGGDHPPGVTTFPRLRIPLHGHYNAPKRSPGKGMSIVYAAPSDLDGSTTRQKNNQR